MNDLIVSLDGNVIKASMLKNGELMTQESELAAQVVDKNVILQPDLLSEKLLEVVNSLTDGKRARYKLTFAIGFEGLEFKFVTLPKYSEDMHAKIVEEIRAKLEGVALEDLYFSYVKVAPFVYQFIGVKKAVLDGYINLSTSIGMELKAVLPWVLMLPKYVGSNQSSIFLWRTGTKPVVVLSELGGVFFVGSYDDEKSPEELSSLIQELSIYKRPKPIDKIYTLNYADIKDFSGFVVHKIELPNADPQKLAGYEVNLLTQYMLDLAPDVLTSQTNLLNLLPLPEISKNTRSLTPVKATVGAVLLALLIFSGGAGLIRLRNNQTNLTQPTGENPQVLSENSATSESTSTTTQESQTPALNKSDLSIRIENGSGINGIAAKTKTLLEGLGYKVDSIDTAELTRETTLVKFKKDRVAYKEPLLKDLAEKYPDIIVEEDLDVGLAYEALVVVGGNVVTE